VPWASRFGQGMAPAMPGRNRFGLERLIMAAAGDDSLRRWGRSLSYLDGIRLNI
jgi:hypothetical protein